VKTNGVFIVNGGRLKEPAHIVKLKNGIIGVIPMYASLLDHYLIVTFYKKNGALYEKIDTTPELITEMKELQ